MKARLAMLVAALLIPSLAWPQTPSLTPLTPGQQVQLAVAVQEYDNQDFADALPIFQSLAAIGDARSETDLGQMYYCGCGVTQDAKRALMLQKLSAAQGYVKGEYRLGNMYLDDRNYPAAYHWLHLAALQGDPDAEMYYGWLFVQGDDATELCHCRALVPALGRAK